MVIIGVMPGHRIGKFETEGLADLARLAVGISPLIGAGMAAALAAGRLGHFDAMRWWAFLARRFLGLRERILGLENVDPRESYLVMPLHEGFADPLLLAHLPLEFRFVARDELFDWPLLGIGLRASRQIQIEPEAPLRRLRKMLGEMGRAREDGLSIVLFPQGSILGIEAAFNPGAFRIADRLGMRVLPVVLTGTHRVWEHPYSPRLRFGCSVAMTVLEPLPLGAAVSRGRALEKEMKRMALSDREAPARRYIPERDGFWDGYAFEIDPDFPEVAESVRRHRSETS